MAVEQFSSGEPEKPFYQIWIDAVTKPNVENYRQIVNDPKASLGTALLWLAGVGFLGSLISGLMGMIFGSSAAYMQYLGSDYAAPATFFGVIGGAFASIFFTPIGALIGVGLIQLVAKALGGTGDFEKFFYAFAAYWVPISLVNAVIGSIPVVGCLSVFVGIYGLVLMVFANEAAHEYETWKAVVSSIAVPLLLLIVLFACIFILVLLGVATALPFLEDFANQFGMMILPFFV